MQLYFLSKLRKKNKSVSSRIGRSKGVQWQKKVKTFEELLGEFTGLNTLEKDGNIEEKVIEGGTNPAKEIANEVAEKKPNSKDKTPEPVSELTFPKIVPLNKNQHFKEYEIEDSQDRPKQITAREIRKEFKSPRGSKKPLF